MSKQKTTPKKLITYANGQHPIVNRNIWDSYIGQRTPLDLTGYPVDELVKPEHELASDLFWMLYQYDVQLTNRQIYPYNRQVIENFLANPQIASLRQQTAGVHSLSRYVAEKLFLSLLDDKQEQEQAQAQSDPSQGDGEDEGEGSPADGDGDGQDNDKAPQGNGQGNKQGDGNGQGDKQDSTPNGSQDGRGEAQGEQSKQEAVKTKMAVHKAIGEAQQATEEAQAQAKSWGVSPSTDLSQVPYEQIKALAEQSSPYLKNLARAIGRFEKVALAAINNPEIKDGFSPHKIRYSRNLDDLWFDELASLHNLNPLHEEQMEKLERRGLASWEKKDPVLEAGNFLLAVDESGSMAGNEIFYAKAVAMSLCRVANLQKRNYRLSAFGGEHNDLRYLASTDSYQDHINWMETFMSAGSTSFVRPIKWFNQQMMAKDKLERADMVLITDGASPNLSNDLVAKFVANKKATGATLLVVLIGGGASADAVKDVADYVLKLPDLSNESSETFAREAAKLLLQRRKTPPKRTAKR